jgi:alkylation response protein AidB-like acyl-CoA dehydrogenase
MAFFDLSRIVVAAGVGAGALEEALKHIKKRQQFGMPLAAFQSISSSGRNGTHIRAARNLTTRRPGKRTREIWTTAW